MTILDLQGNQISEINNLNQLTNLIELDLSGNQISEIKNLDALGNLTELNLFRNQIRNLDGLSVGLLEKITYIDLSDNPIEGTTITDWKNPEAILGYLQSLQDTQVINYHLKVNIIGCISVLSSSRSNLVDHVVPLAAEITSPQVEYVLGVWDGPSLP